MKYTKKKWEINFQTNRIETKENVICDMWGMATEEGKANAKLIAAAPELIEALIECEAILTGLFHTARVQQTSILTNTNFANQENYNAIADRFSKENKENYEILKRVKQAIKKATE